MPQDIITLVILAVTVVMIVSLITDSDPGHRGAGQGAEKRQKRRPGGNAPLVDRRIYLRRIRP